MITSKFLLRLTNLTFFYSQFAHTVLQQINTASLETPLSAVDGVFTFYWQVVALVLQIPQFKNTAPSHVILSDTAFCRALKLIVQLGCSNALAYENTDDDHGNFGSFGYDGQWLDVGDVMGTADLTNNLCSYSLQKFHQSILVSRLCHVKNICLISF